MSPFKVVVPPTVKDLAIAALLLIVVVPVVAPSVRVVAAPPILRVVAVVLNRDAIAVVVVSVGVAFLLGAFDYIFAQLLTLIV